MIPFIRVVEAIHAYCRQHNVNLPTVTLNFPTVDERERFKTRLRHEFEAMAGPVHDADLADFTYHDIKFRIVTGQRYASRYAPREIDDIMFEAQAAKARHNIEGMWRALDELIDLWGANRPASNFRFFDLQKELANGRR